MDQLGGDTLMFLAGALGVVLVLQAFLALYLFNSIRISRKERSELHREMFGLLRKIEGLTASRREQMLKHYDSILEDISTRLPPTLASEAGQIIFETESRILTRLAEIEPNLKDDEESRQKMDQLIKSMENLENTIISLTTETVQNVMAENRTSLFDDDIRVSTRHLAA